MPVSKKVSSLIAQFRKECSKGHSKRRSVKRSRSVKRRSVKRSRSVKRRSVKRSVKRSRSVKRRSVKRRSVKRRSVKRSVSTTAKKLYKTYMKHINETCKRQTTKKYKSRNSPAFPANKCCGMTKRGNDGRLYRSKRNSNGICSWKYL